MGCDIHMYIEYKEKNTNYPQWNSFGGNMSPGRNYLMFGLIANVRWDTKKEPFFYNPKGLPDNTGWKVNEDNRLFITDNPSDNEVDIETAIKYSTYGCKIYSMSDGTPGWVDHPDWHSHSWLSTEEYEKIINCYSQHPSGLMHKEPEYHAILSAMKTLEELGCDARIVFWFDN